MGHHPGIRDQRPKCNLRPADNSRPKRAEAHPYIGTPSLMNVSSAALSYRWLINDFPNFIKKDDDRWFVSQVTGNLYMAKAEPNDTGNYFCFTTINMDISTKSTFSKAIQLTALPDGTQDAHAQLAPAMRRIGVLQ